jgi:hypothetical protein
MALFLPNLMDAFVQLVTRGGVLIPLLLFLQTFGGSPHHTF